MELRTLRYFLTVAREKSISRAAEILHITQPTLSRQLAGLEQEVGSPLFLRGKRRFTLTEAGVFLQKRAEMIVSLADRTEADLKNTGSAETGDIYIGTGESRSIENIVRIAHQLHRDHPGIRFHFTSGDAADLTDRLDRGLFDFCVLYGDIDQSKYEYLPLPYRERWGLLIRDDSPLATREVVTTTELWSQPLILSRHAMGQSHFFKWLGRGPEALNVVGTHNLIYTGMLMAEAGMGCVITLEGLVNTCGTGLCFRPIIPEEVLRLSLVWRRGQPLTRAAARFLDALSEETVSAPAL